MAEKYVGINGKTNKLAKLILEQEEPDKKTLTIGQTWEMGGGYTLKVQSIDAKSTPRIARLVLRKNGAIFDDKVIEAASTDGTGTQGVYRYCANIGNESNVPIFVTYIESVFSGATSEMVQLKYTWLIDNNVTEVKAGDMYGIFKVDTENPLLVLKSDSSVSLSKDSVVTLAGNLKFRVSDSDNGDVRFYPMVIRNTPGTWEVRGTVVNASKLIGTTWNSESFAGFWYNLKDNKSTEMIRIVSFSSERTIDKYNLIYTTTTTPLLFKLSQEKNRTVEYGLDAAETIQKTGGRYYDVVGWMGEKYVGINAKTNKLAKLVYEQDTSDKMTLTVGDTWELGGGYTLKAQEIDPRSYPRLVRFVLSKDGAQLDVKVIEAAVSYGTGIQGVYTYYANIGGESNVPIFVTYIDSVFSGATSDMVQLKYTWLIDNTVLEVKVEDIFGIFKVETENPLLLQSNSSVSLSKDSVVTLAGNLKFRVSDSDNGDVRFYPKIDYLIGEETVSPALTSIKVSPATASVIVGNTTTFTAAPKDKNGNPITTTVTWSSSKTSVGTINASTGVFTAVAPGTTTITAKSGNVSGTANAIVPDLSVEIRGTVVNATLLNTIGGNVSWNSANFAGFWYDLKDHKSTESLTILSFTTERNIDKYNLTYVTTKTPLRFKVSNEKNRTVEYGLDSTSTTIISTGGNYYDVVGWMAEKYVAINAKNNKLAKLVYEQDTADKMTLTVGQTWNIGGGYALTAQSIDARSNPRLAWLVLSKDGAKLDDKVIEEASTDLKYGGTTQGVYTYYANIGGESNVPIFVTYIDTVFSGATSDMVQLKYTWLIDSMVTEVKAGDMYGIFKVDSENPLTLKSDSSVSLSKDSVVTLAGNLKLRVSDSENGDVRFYPMIVRNTPGTWEVRGSIVNATAQGTTGTVSWDSSNFAGFWYDLKTNQSTETLNVQSFKDIRTIDKGQLWYYTSIAPTMFKVASEKGRNVEYGLDATGTIIWSTGAQYYDVVGWMGEKYVGINRKNNKLAKLILEQDTSDKMTLTVGQTWEMGGGYTLKVQGIDNRSYPRLVWLILSKNGAKLDDKVIEAAASDGTGTQGVYTYYANIGGESNVPIFVTYIDSVFSDIVELKYTWLIDNSITDVKAGDIYGIFKVDTEYPLSLKSNSSVSLNRDSTVTLAGDLKFRISDSSDTDVRFYPKIDYVIPEGVTTPYSLSISINRGEAYTGSTSVALSLSAINATQMSFSSDGLTWSPWESFVTTKSWVLSSGDGLKIVSFKANNAAGNASTVSESITLDTTKPSVTNLTTSTSTPLINQSVNISVRVNDNISLARVNISITHPSKWTETFQMNIKNSSSSLNSIMLLEPTPAPGGGSSGGGGLIGGEFHFNFSNTTEYGRYNVTILASDGAGNTNNTEKTWFVTTMPPYVNNSVNTTANNVTEIDAREKVNTTLLLFTSNNTTGGAINITLRSSIPPEINQTFSLTPLGKYITINASEDLKNNLTSGWFIIKIFYTNVELNGLDENSLKISWYNETLKSWENLAPGSPTWVHGAGVATADINGFAGYVWVNISHLSTFGIVGSYPIPTQSLGGSGGGGGGGGGGSSGENYANIEVVEKYDLQISKDALTSYRFTSAKNPIMFVNITGNTSLGMITTSIEVLKNISTLVKTAPDGLVYKNANIWVGTSGFATPKNIKEALIKFRINNPWMSANGVSASDIVLMKWDGKGWINLETNVLSKDDTNAYFEGKTNSFSPFAIVAKTTPIVKPAVTTTPVETPKVTATPTPAPTKKVPGFGIVLALVGLMAVVLRRRGW